LFNGTILDGRFSVETYSLDEARNPMLLHGKLGTKSASTLS